MPSTRITHIDRTAPTPSSFWSYKAPPTPSLEDAKALNAVNHAMTEQGWTSLSPGMRREIVRSAQKRATAATEA